MSMDDLEILPAELRARRGEETFDPSLLFRHQGKVVTREMLFDDCWGLNHVPQSRTLDQHISQLRKWVERDPKSPRLIRTVHGAGYRFDP